MHKAAPRSASQLLSGSGHLVHEELWAWVQASPAVHLVSRRLPPLLPAFPQGCVLHDAVLSRSALGSRSEEAAYAQDRCLARNLRRGLSFIEPLAMSTGSASVATLIRRGLPKFCDLDHAAVAEALQQHLPGTNVGHFSDGNPQARSCVRDSLADGLAEGLASAWGGGEQVAFTQLTKANGENAQVSFFPPTQQWVLCSKNVSMLAKKPEDITLPEWSHQRYRFARIVAEVWFLQLQNVGAAKRAQLQERLSGLTLVGELLGAASHLVAHNAAGRTVQWFAVVPHEEDDACWPPSRSIAFFQETGLPMVHVPSPSEDSWYGAPTAGMSRLRTLADMIDLAPLEEAGEGCVIYAVARSEAAAAAEASTCQERMLWLTKLKTAEYRLLRRMREKAKGFAQAGGSLLIEDAVADFRTSSQSSQGERQRVDEMSASFQKLCQYILVEEIPPSIVDSEFLRMLSLAKSHEGLSSVKRQPAKMVCIIAPPFCLTDAELATVRQALLEHGSAAMLSADLPYLSSGTLASLWHRSNASQGIVCLNHIPITVERALSLQDDRRTASKAEDADLRGPPPSKRRKITSMIERRVAASHKMHHAMRTSRCLFIFSGWNEATYHRSIAAAKKAYQTALNSENADGDAPALCASPLSREAHSFMRAPECQQYSMLRKWGLHAQRLQAKLPAAAALSLPGPSITTAQTPDMGQARFSSSASSPASSPSILVRALEQLASGKPLCTVVVVMSLGLPGMGKSSLLERLYSSCKQISAKCFLHGVPDVDATPLHDCQREVPLSAVALLSSDAFTGREMRKQGLKQSEASSSQVARCRQAAADAWRCGVADFLEFAAREGGGRVTEKAPPQFLLILDKNFPPEGVRNEVELLLAAAPHGCDLRVLSVCLTPAGAAPPAHEDLEQAELQRFGAWSYPWSPEVLVECAARLWQRSDHDTLVGGSTAIFVLLSFFKLHHRESFSGLEQSAGVRLHRLPSLALSGPLASWPAAEDATGTDSDAVRLRYEARTLLRQALNEMQQPFGPVEPVQPALTALEKLLTSAGLRSPTEAEREMHASQCCQDLQRRVMEVAAEAAVRTAVRAQQVAVRYVALSVEGHHDCLEKMLQRASTAMSKLTGHHGLRDPYPVPPGSRPDFLHITTMYVDSGCQLTDERRKFLARSRQLCQEGAAFECVVTHLVCARGALAAAVVLPGPLQEAGVPLDARRPHITLRVNPPWKPRHSNDVLAALDGIGVYEGMKAAPPPPPKPASVPSSGDQEGLWLPPPPPSPPKSLPTATPAGLVRSHSSNGDVGCWCQNVQVGSAVVDVFVLQLAKPMVLAKNPITLV